MKNRSRCFCSLGAILLVSLLFAVEKSVNFSGTWLLDKTERSFQPPLDAGGGASGGRGGGGFPGAGGDEGAAGGFPGGGGRGGGSRGGMGRGGFPGGAPSGRGAVEQQELKLIITQSETDIRMEQLRGSGTQKPVTQVLALDGKVHASPGATGRGEISFKAQVKKAKLLIEGERKASVGGREVTIWTREQLSLSKDGKVLTRETSTSTPEGTTRIKQRFRKQP